MADTVRGDGLAIAKTALAALAEDQSRLDCERERFSNSPSYRSHQSHNSTRSQSPNPLSEDQRRHEERRVQLQLERDASLPYEQFGAQRREEEERIIGAHRSRTHRLAAGTDIYQLAYKNVKQRWVEQGIWNDKWNRMASGRWKHEETLELKSELEAQLKQRRPKSAEEKQRWIAEQRARQKREREASRPFYQFIYQVSKERERFQDESGTGEDTYSTDINTKAYNNVKNTWIRRRIWNKNWGILPGMSWKHEEPLEEEAADSSAPVQANTHRSGSYEVEEAAIKTTNGTPFRYISGHVVTDLSASGIFMSNHCQWPSAIYASQQNPPADIDSLELENGDSENSPSDPNLAPQRQDRRTSRPTAGEARSSKRKPSLKDGQTQAVESTCLKPVHTPKVSKASTKKGQRARRRPDASEAAPSPGSDIAENQAVSMPPRRSKRSRLTEPRITKGSHLFSTHPLKSEARPKRNIAGNSKSISSAKPQGVSKRQRLRTKK